MTRRDRLLREGQASALIGCGAGQKVLNVASPERAGPRGFKPGVCREAPLFRGGVRRCTEDPSKCYGLRGWGGEEKPSPFFSCRISRPFLQGYFSAITGGNSTGHACFLSPASPGCCQTRARGGCRSLGASGRCLWISLFFSCLESAVWLLCAEDPECSKGTGRQAVIQNK